VSGDTWGGLAQGRTLRVVARFHTPTGRVREVDLTHQDLLEILGDAAHALAKIEQARALNGMVRERP
jgi:hypothetical protein